MKKYILQLIVFTFVTSWNFTLAAEEKPDYWPTKDWRSATPESQGMNSDLLENITAVRVNIIKSL